VLWFFFLNLHDVGESETMLMFSGWGLIGENHESAVVPSDPEPPAGEIRGAYSPDAQEDAVISAKAPTFHPGDRDQ
jgi:hypothetical protein